MNIFRFFLILSLISILLSIASFAQVKKNPKLGKKKMSAYLMVYFKDESHGLYIALSKDGYSFTDINKGKPVIAGDTIAEQKGIRDPYIYRAPNGIFYMALTDLHIYASKAGYRNTEWERDGEKYGWGNNRGMVIMKSVDLIHWSHHIIRVDKAFPELADIGCAWAPELIYDENRKKTMIYFTMRFGNQQNRVYYSYMDKDLTTLETRPKLLFDYPKDITYIDADITKVGDKYHLFYVPHDGTPGIKQMVSDSLTTGYKYQENWIDPEPKACEAPTTYKRIGENKWVLIYDVYGISPHNFGFSETSDFKNFKVLGHFNEGVMKATNFASPKHPAVIPITKKEAKRLAAYWKADLKF